MLILGHGFACNIFRNPTIGMPIIAPCLFNRILNLYDTSKCELFLWEFSAHLRPHQVERQSLAALPGVAVCTFQNALPPHSRQFFVARAAAIGRSVDHSRWNDAGGGGGCFVEVTQATTGSAAGTVSQVNSELWRVPATRCSNY